MSRQNPVVRAFRKLRDGGLKGVLEALKWKLYRRKVMVVAVREVGAPIEVPKRSMVPPGFRVELATLEHLDMMAANFPHKREWYRERLGTPGYYCSLGIVEGEVIAHNWFCTCPHFDPEMRTWVRPAADEAYWFEGWCTPDRRGMGVGYYAFTHAFEEILPDTPVKRVFTYLEPSNRPTRRIHKRYGFVDTGIKKHLRLGPFYFNSKTKPLPPDHEA